MIGNYHDPDAKNIVAGVARVIANRAAEVRRYLAQGWTMEAALAKVRQSSTLGPKAWAELLDTLKTGLEVTP